MDNYVGLDVSCKTVSICILNKDGQVVREVELTTDPDTIYGFLVGTGLKITTIGLESGSLTHWLTKKLREYGYEVHPMESRKMAAILAATKVNKTDKNDARGIAEALRAGHYSKCVHRSDTMMELRTVLKSRDLLVKQRTRITNNIKGCLKIFGIKLSKGINKDFSAKVMKAIEYEAEAIKISIKSLLACFSALENEIKSFDKWLKRQSSQMQEAQQLKSVDGVGEITALAFLTEIDDALRFKRSRDVAAYLGLTPSQYSSGEIQKQGRISKRGTGFTRSLLIEAATTLLTRSKHWSPIKAWGMKLMRKKGAKKAIVAVARKLATTMHSMLVKKTFYDRRGEKLKALANNA